MKTLIVDYKYLIIIMITVVVLVVRVPQYLAHGDQKVYNKWMILTMILDNIERNYVNETDSDELLKNAVNGMLAGLDQHSVYLSAEEYKDREARFLGFIGLGIRFKQMSAQYVIISITDNSPAFLAGLMIGDKILEIDGRQTTLLKEEQVQKLLEGVVNSQVTILVNRAGFAEPIKFTMNRTFINIKSIPCYFMLNNITGYIKISHFVNATPEELDYAYKQLLAGGMKQLLVDLRDNTGGSLMAGIQATDRFISKGKVIVTTRGKTPQDNQKYMSSAVPAFSEIPLVIMVNAGTASVAEIFAAAIQDWDRGLLFGEVTFGKACVQTEFPFPDGSALLLTTANYYTPLGRMIQHSTNGVPAAKNGVSKPGNKENQSWKEFKTPKGRIVYEGNGLRPDIFSKVKGEGLVKPVVELYSRNVFFNYAEKLIQKNPAIKTDINKFFSKFTVTDAMLAEFTQAARAAHAAIPDKELKKYQQQIKQALLQEIAFNLWGLEGAIRAAALKDSRVQEGLLYFPQAQKLLF